MKEYSEGKENNDVKQPIFLVKSSLPISKGMCWICDDCAPALLVIQSQY